MSLLFFHFVVFASVPPLRTNCVNRWITSRKTSKIFGAGSNALLSYGAGLAHFFMMSAGSVNDELKEPETLWQRDRESSIASKLEAAS